VAAAGRLPPSLPRRCPLRLLVMLLIEEAYPAAAMRSRGGGRRSAWTSSIAVCGGYQQAWLGSMAAGGRLWQQPAKFSGHHGVQVLSESHDRSWLVPAMMVP